MHTTTTPVSALATLADRICQRRPLFLPGGVPESDLDALADADEADLLALAETPADRHADRRAKATVLAGRDLAGGMSLGEATLLISLLADLTGRNLADPLRTCQTLHLHGNRLA